MKKLIIALIVALMVAIPATANNNYIYLIDPNPHDANSVAASQNESSYAIDLSAYDPDGFFAIYVLATGDGTATIELTQSVDGTTYIETIPDIATGFTKTSGPGGDGKAIYRVRPMPMRWMKFKVTETGGVAAVVITIKLAVQ